MEHHFIVEVAKEYGVNAAIILNHLYFWVKQSQANNKNYYEGAYWTYNSVRAFEELFPYMSSRQISTTLKKLETEGLIKSGNFNKSAYDRTLWYSITEKGFYILKQSIMQKCKMDSAKMSNGLCENVKPIPDINTDRNTDNININARDKNFGVENEKTVIDMFNEICKSYPEGSYKGNKKAIQELLKAYDIDTIKEGFEKAESSNFLKGHNKYNWSAQFSWIIQKNNFEKVISGMYGNNEKINFQTYGATYDISAYESRSVIDEEEN